MNTVNTEILNKNIVQSGVVGDGSLCVANFRESLYSQDSKVHHVAVGTSIRAWLEQSGFWKLMQECPIVVFLNGSEILERDYDTVLQTGDIVELQQLPRGPGAVAVITWVYYAAVIITAIYVLTMPEPGIPDAADVKEGSPTYSISARGNRYRPGTNGPILYGTLRIVPDFDQPPFSSYDTNNDQTLHMLFRITQGLADINLPSISFEDTPLSNFQGYQLEIVAPGSAPTLFPVGVVESGDLSNVELEDGFTPAYVANDVGTLITKIGVDFSSPSIANQDKQSGTLNSYTVRFDVQAQAINDSGVAIGGWVTLGQEAFSAASADAIRRTFEYAVDAGRYQVRVQRITPKNDSQYVRDNVTWAGLKGFIYDPDDISPNTRLAVSIRASEQIGNRALSDMSVICSRKLPVWDSVDGWSPPTLTNSIGWAMADLCRNSYAGNRSDLNYDLVRLAELDAQLTPLEHEFNAYFDSEGVTVWEALVKAGTAGRITPIDKGGFYTFVRDEYQSQAVQAFTMRNIVRDSFSIEHQGVLEETADAIIVKIQDKANDYRIRDILCALPDSPALNPRKIDLFGVTDATRAKELGMFMAACNRYRRKLTPFETGIEGRIPFFGSKIAVSHFLLGQEGVKQVSGDITDFDGVDRIRISEKIKTGAYTDPHIVMIDLDGKPMPAYPINIISEFVVQVVGDVDWSQIQIDPSYKNPMFVIGSGVTYVTESKVLKIQRDGAVVRFEAFVDDPRVYIYGDDVVPPPDITIPGPQTAAPVISDLQSHVGGTVEEPLVTLSWNIKNADRTDVQFSGDGGVNFFPIGLGFTLTNQLQHRPLPGNYIYRVAAVNLFRGPWVQVAVDTTTSAFNPPLPPSNLALREAFTGPYLKLQWDSDSYRHFIEVLVAGIVKYTVVVEGEQWDFLGNLAQEYGIGRSFTVKVYAVGDNGKTSLTAPSINVSNPAPAQLNNLAVTPLLGQVVVTFDWPAGTDIEGINVWKSNANGFVPGAANLSINKSRDPVLKVPVGEAELAYIRVAAVDNWGEAGLNISGQFTVTGKSVDTAAIQAELDALAEDLEDLQADLGEAESDINGIISELININSDLSLLNGKFPITETSIANDAISTPKLQANAVTAEKVVAGAIVTDKLGANAVTADKVAALAIVTEKLAALAVSADKLAANSVSADKIVANAVTAEKIAALAITAAKIAANTITADKLIISQLSAIAADLGLVTAGTFQTTSGTTPRFVASSSGSYPMWIGNGALVNDANGLLYLKVTGGIPDLVFKGKLSVKNATSGGRLEIESNFVRVYDAANVLRVELGELS